MVAKSVCHGKGCNLILSVGPSVWYAGDVANLRKQDVRGRAEVRPRAPDLWRHTNQTSPGERNFGGSGI